jgi:ATP-dependent Clp protease ATP-binding subunit ClpC
VFALSRKEADRLNHNFVGTEHLLLGLIKLGSDMGAYALIEMDIDLEKLRNEIEKFVDPGPDEKPINNCSYTPRVRRVLDLAANEARTLKQTCIGTEHILLGLLAEGQGVAALVLRNFNVNIEVTRNTLKKLYAKLPSD